MSSFCRKVVEYMYQTRLDEFISSFYELYERYNHMNEEDFLREWFDRTIIRNLVFYFPPSAIITSFEELKSTKRSLLKTYVKTYWDFCRNPRKHPIRIEEAMKFFGLEEISEEKLKEAYRNMVKRYHPDRIGKSRYSHMMMVKINYYYQILRRYLSDRYERSLSAGQKV